MQSQGNIRVVEMLRYLYQHTDENHTATVTDITAYLKERGIQAVRQTVYADLNALITAGFDIVIVKSTQNQYFMGNRLFEYPELKCWRMRWLLPKSFLQRNRRLWYRSWDV